ncbi:MAG: zinc ribbon domain-containing protein [Pelolinea sp.]|nr:zinc ribbon domain-containing protein [Pelolinea sp.]
MEISVTELHPLVRALIIAMLISVPILLVILRRLPDIREILRHPNRGEGVTRDARWPFNIGSGKDVSICPKCFRQNPPDYKFCGFCGSEMTVPKKEN